MLQEEVVYATEEVERLTKVLDEQTGLLQASQDQATQNEATVQTLQDKVPCRERNDSLFIHFLNADSCIHNLQ